MSQFRRALTTLTFAIIFAATGAFADQPVFHAEQGTAIGGFDTVAYFTDGVAVKGDPKYRLMWKGAIWQFASQEHLDAFEANPRGFAPQYGGYCAYAVARGYTVGTDPEAWRIIDDKLYLIHSDPIMDRWLADLDENLRLSDENWPVVLKEQ